jgi:hypothetical protein
MTIVCSNIEPFLSRGEKATFVRWLPSLRWGRFGLGKASEIAVLMDRSAVFIGVKIDREIQALTADRTGYFWDQVTTHRIPPFGRSQAD